MIAQRRLNAVIGDRGVGEGALPGPDIERPHGDLHDSGRIDQAARIEEAAQSRAPPAHREFI